MSVSGSPRSDTMASIDEGSLDSVPFRKTSSKMSVDSSLIGTRHKTSSKMSVDPSSPNVYHSTQRRTSSRMSVDVPSARRSRGSSDRMLLDEIQYDYQNLPQQAQIPAPFTASPAAWPTTGSPHSASIYASQGYTLTGVALPSSFSMAVSQKMSLSHGTRSPRGEAKLAPMPSSPPPSSFMQHIQGKHKYNSPAPSTPPLPCTSKSPASATVLPLRWTDSAPVAPPKTVSPKTPALRQGSRCPSTKRETIHSPISSGRVRARGSSSGDEVSHKRHCVRQSPPIALLAIDPHPARGPSLQPAQSISPMDEVQWLPPMEQQLETARQSQLKAKFRKFKAIIGGAVNDIKQAIMPYNKDHCKNKTSPTRSGSRSFAGVPDYLRSTAERLDSSKPPIYRKRTSFDIRKDIDTIAETWTNLGLCDSPTSLHGDDGTVHGEAPQLYLPLPRINEPPRSSRSSRPGPGTGDGSITKIRSDEKVEIYVGTATNLAAPTFRRRRTADAFDTRGVVDPHSPNNDRKSSRSTKM